MGSGKARDLSLVDVSIELRPGESNLNSKDNVHQMGDLA